MSHAPTNNRLGILLMVAVTFTFACMDSISRHLAGEYTVFMVVMIRYWFFAGFVVMVSYRNGTLHRDLRPNHLWLQALRGALLALEVVVVVWGFTLLGLIETHAVFAVYPLLIAALSGPILGEAVGWRRWAAILMGLIGVLIILNPGTGVFSPLALIPLLGAFMFALYGLLTRYVARGDSASTSFLWTGTVGAVVMTAIGIWFWEPMSGGDWLWMALLCVISVMGHWMLIKCYEVAEASLVQPFAYLQLVFVSIMGVLIFGEAIRQNVMIGAAIVVAAGVFTLIRARQKEAPSA